MVSTSKYIILKWPKYFIFSSRILSFYCKNILFKPKILFSRKLSWKAILVWEKYSGRKNIIIDLTLKYLSHHIRYNMLDHRYRFCDRWRYWESTTPNTRQRIHLQKLYVCYSAGFHFKVASQVLSLVCMLLLRDLQTFHHVLRITCSTAGFPEARSESVGDCVPWLNKWINLTRVCFYGKKKERVLGCITSLFIECGRKWSASSSMLPLWVT